MKTRDFIIQKLNNLVLEFPGLFIGYKYEGITDTHLISVEPLSVFENNENYILRESDITSEFCDLFPTESILFVSTESLNYFSDPEISFTFKSLIVTAIAPLANYRCSESSCHNQNASYAENNYALAA